MIRIADALVGGDGGKDFPTDLLSGLRATIGVVLEEMPSAIRNVLVYFLLLFFFRILLRREWAAAVGFAGMFALLGMLSNEHPWMSALISFLYFGSGAFAVLRWGLVAYAVGNFVSSLLLNTIATRDTSAWYFGNTVFLIAIVVALGAWSLYTATAGRLWSTSAAGS
jgi:hypothetical protein